MGGYQADFRGGGSRKKVGLRSTTKKKTRWTPRGRTWGSRGGGRRSGGGREGGRALIGRRRQLEVLTGGRPNRRLVSCPVLHHPFSTLFSPFRYIHFGLLMYLRDWKLDLLIPCRGHLLSVAAVLILLSFRLFSIVGSIFSTVYGVLQYTMPTLWTPPNNGPIASN
jgi:hypothetical protein